MLAIVQARMGSKRLPGKVMKRIGNQPLLGYLLDRLECSMMVTKIKVAIPQCDMYSEIREYCLSRVPCVWHDPEDDVAGRFAHALENENAPEFIRVCADSPLLDPRLVDLCCRDFATHNANWLRMEGFPSGQSVEIIRTGVFFKFLDQIDRREHVMPWYYENIPGRTVCPDTDMSHHRLVVDTQEDFDRIKTLIEGLERRHTQYGLEELCSRLY